MGKKNIEEIGKELFRERKIKITEMENIGINVDAIMRNCSRTYREKMEIKNRQKYSRLPEHSHYISR